MAANYYDSSGNVIDFYTIFNLPYDAVEEQVKSAFRALIKRYHPDTSESFRESHLGKIDLIIRGYRILSDEDSRRDYDRALFQSRDPRAGSFMVVPKKRIKYSASLGELLRARINPRNAKRKDILYNIGQDVEIFVTAIEAKKGAVAQMSDAMARAVELGRRAAEAAQYLEGLAHGRSVQGQGTLDDGLFMAHPLGIQAGTASGQLGHRPDGLHASPATRCAGDDE